MNTFPTFPASSVTVVVENDEVSAEEIGYEGMWTRQVEISNDKGDYKCEAYCINDVTGEKVFRGCVLLELYEAALDKAYDWVNYREFNFY